MKNEAPGKIERSGGLILIFSAFFLKVFALLYIVLCGVNSGQTRSVRVPPATTNHFGDVVIINNPDFYSDPDDDFDEAVIVEETDDPDYFPGASVSG